MVLSTTTIILINGANDHLNGVEMNLFASILVSVQEKKRIVCNNHCVYIIRHKKCMIFSGKLCPLIHQLILINFASRETDFDDILAHVARELTSENLIEKLGIALGIELPDIRRCLQTNQKGSDVTDRGTLTMLRDWRQSVTEEKEQCILRAALLEAKLNRIAEKCFPGGLYKSCKIHQDRNISAYFYSKILKQLPTDGKIKKETHSCSKNKKESKNFLFSSSDLSY